MLCDLPKFAVFVMPCDFSCYLYLITYAYVSRGGQVFNAVCLFVFPDGISKTSAARITKLDI